MFSLNLKELRKARNLSQEDIAKRLYITRQTVSGWENGRCEPDIDMLKALADVLEVDVQALICGTKERKGNDCDRKFLIPTFLFGGIVIVFVLFRLLAYSRLLEYRNTTYNAWLGEILLFLYPQFGFLVGGMFISSLHNMYTTMQFSRLCRCILRCVATALVSFTVLIMVGYLPFNIPVISRFSFGLLLQFGKPFVVYILPFVAGGMLILSMKK